jgi:DNA modification methylase
VVRRVIKVYVGDCRETLKNLADQSVHTCVTSPPYYGLRNYNDEDLQIGIEETPEQFVDNLVQVFREVKRVLRDDGTLWLNLGDSYGEQHGKGFNTNKNEGYTNRSEEMQLKQGDVKVKTGLPRKNLLGMPWRVALALQADGWILRQDIIWHKPNPMPESVTDRCTKAHEYIFLLSKQAKYYYDNEAIKELSKFPNGPDSPQSIKKGVGDEGMEVRSGLSKIGALEKRNKRSVWTVTTKPYKEAHFATFPKDLIEPCVLAGSPEGGVVLDPFGGSGTTAQVADGFNRDAILCELSQDYVDIMKRRLDIGQDMFTEMEIIEDENSA